MKKYTKPKKKQVKKPKQTQVSVTNSSANCSHKGYV